MIFEFPSGFIQVAYFTIPRIQTWGSKYDQEFKNLVRHIANLKPETRYQFDWHVFSIRCVFAESRKYKKRQTPDIENIPKLIVDAFAGSGSNQLYEDDNLRFVRGVQVEAEFGPDHEEKTEVWIFGKKT